MICNARKRCLAPLPSDTALPGCPQACPLIPLPGRGPGGGDSGRSGVLTPAWLLSSDGPGRVPAGFGAEAARGAEGGGEGVPEPEGEPAAGRVARLAARDNAPTPWLGATNPSSLFQPTPAGPHQRLLQREHLQGAPLDAHHLAVGLPSRPAPGRQAAGAHGHVLHQHLQHLERAEPPLRLQPALRAGHGQQLHRAVRARVPARLAERQQLLPRHPVRQQRQQQRQAGRLRPVRQGQQGFRLLLPPFPILFPKLGPQPAPPEADADARLSPRDGSGPGQRRRWEEAGSVPGSTLSTTPPRTRRDPPP